MISLPALASASSLRISSLTSSKLRTVSGLMLVTRRMTGPKAAVDDWRRAAIGGDRESGIGELGIGHAVAGEIAEQHVARGLALGRHSSSKLVRRSTAWLPQRQLPARDGKVSCSMVRVSGVRKLSLRLSYSARISSSVTAAESAISAGSSFT